MNISAKYKFDPKEIRVYKSIESCIFKKNNEDYGGLSNMATVYPLKVNGISIKTCEALYQACRFPHLPDIQRKIIEAKSPMTVKMTSNANRNYSRQDWDHVKLKIMKWCISVKMAQNFISFGALLHSTGLKNIVENSAKDNYWGAIPNEDFSIFTGVNALGRLLMDLRQTFYSKEAFSLLLVEPLNIDNFLLYEKSISVIDERGNFLNWLIEYWDSKYPKVALSNFIDCNNENYKYINTEKNLNVSDEKENYKNKMKNEEKVKTKKKRNLKTNSTSQENLFSN